VIFMLAWSEIYVILFFAVFCILLSFGVLVLMLESGLRYLWKGVMLSSIVAFQLTFIGMIGVTIYNLIINKVL
jgi:hypothetical protein